MTRFSVFDIGWKKVCAWRALASFCVLFELATKAGSSLQVLPNDASLCSSPSKSYYSSSRRGRLPMFSPTTGLQTTWHKIIDGQCRVRPFP